MGNCISLNGRTEIAASASASASDSAPLQSLAPHSSSSDVEMEEDTPVFPPFEGLDMASDGSDYDPDDDASNGDTFSSMTIFQRSGSESPPAVQSGGRGGRRHRPVRQVRPAPFGKSRRCQAGISGLARGTTTANSNSSRGWLGARAAAACWYTRTNAANSNSIQAMTALPVHRHAICYPHCVESVHLSSVGILSALAPHRHANNPRLRRTGVVICYAPT